MNLLELQDLYNESLVRETIEQTKAAGLVWLHLGGTQFQATKIEGSVTWDLFITKSQIGNLTFTYTLDIKKDSVAHLTLSDGALPNSARNSQVKDLYEIVEIIVLELDAKLRETLQMVQNIVNCRDE
jgi:hypothetical protein